MGMKTVVREVILPQGTIRYRDEGEGPVLLFVHGLLVDGTVWRKVAAPLSKRFRCIAPDWPLGSHAVPTSPDADLSPDGVAKIVAAFPDARLVRVEDAFVFVQEDQPDAVVAAIDHFVVTSRTSASDPRETSKIRASAAAAVTR